MITEEKEQLMRKQLDQLYDLIDGEGLTAYQQMAFDIYSWLLDDTEAPELE